MNTGGCLAAVDARLAEAEELLTRLESGELGVEAAVREFTAASELYRECADQVLVWVRSRRVRVDRHAQLALAITLAARSGAPEPVRAGR